MSDEDVSLDKELKRLQGRLGQDADGIRLDMSDGRPGRRPALPGACAARWSLPSGWRGVG